MDQVKTQVDSLLVIPSTQSQSQLAAARMGGGGVMPALRSLQSLTRKLAAPATKDDAEGSSESPMDPEPAEASSKRLEEEDPAGKRQALFSCLHCSRHALVWCSREGEGFRCDYAGCRRSGARTQGRGCVRLRTSMGWMEYDGVLATRQRVMIGEMAMLGVV